MAAAGPELDVTWLDGCLEESIHRVSPRGSLERFLKTVVGRGVAKEILASRSSVSVYGAGKASVGFAEAFSDIFHTKQKCEMNGPVELNSDN